MNNKKQPYKILFVEDEEEIRKKYVQYLQNWFNEVFEAKDGEEAYQIYKEKKPSIIIADINLPKLSGLELLQRIRGKDHTTKAIILTAYSDTEYLLSAMELKLTKYLVKPVTRNELKEAIRSVLEEFKNFDTVSKKIVNLKENYYWNLDTNELYKEGQLVILTKNETKIARILFKNINKTVNYNEIIYHVWEEDFKEIDYIKTLKSTMNYLRKKLPKDTIKNVFGIGYRVEIE